MKHEQNLVHILDQLPSLYQVNDQLAQQMRPKRKSVIQKESDLKIGESTAQMEDTEERSAGQASNHE